MGKDKQLLLFIQSPTTDVYVNILTHCINHEAVEDVYFAIDKNSTAAKEEIRKIRARFEELISDITEGTPDVNELQRFRADYEKAYEKVPNLAQTNTRLIPINYSDPGASVSTLKKYFPSQKDLLVDITGCSKKISTDVITSFFSRGFTNVRCFELDKEVFEKRLNRIYHCIRRNLPYYEYVDFSEPNTSTVKSFDRMRSQGYLVKLLLISTAVLGVLVAVLISQQKNTLAQYTSIFIAIMTGLGWINDSFGAAKILKRE